MRESSTAKQSYARRIVFLGPPGSGKGTQARQISTRLEIPQLSTGELLRAAVRAARAEGLEAQGYMQAGELVPDALVIRLLLQRIQQDDCAPGFLLDGFPRTLPQAQALELALEKQGLPVDVVIDLQVDLQSLVKRLAGRRVCPHGHGEWHVEFRPPAQANLCDQCGDTLIRREDDREESVRRRMLVYEESTAPLTEFYRRQGRLRMVEASRGVDEVSAAITEALAMPGTPALKRDCR